MQLRDDWDKPRTQGNHLTEAEIAELRAAFNAGRRPDDIACDLQCATRTASKYYAIFRGIPERARGRPPAVRIDPAHEQKPQRNSRFYTSTFELEG